MKATPPSVTWFPVRLREPLSQAIAALGNPVLDIPDGDESNSTSSHPKSDWRHTKFASMRRVHLPDIQAASVDVFIKYRSSTGRIWSIEIVDASRSLNAILEGLPSESRIPDIISIFGQPSAQHAEEFTEIIDVYWWRRADTVFQVHAFREEHSDITGSWRAGDVQRIRVLALELAPPWEEAFHALPSKGGA